MNKGSNPFMIASLLYSQVVKANNSSWPWVRVPLFYLKSKNFKFFYWLCLELWYNKSKRKIYKEFLNGEESSSKTWFNQKENKKIVMFSHDKAKYNFAIVSVYKSSNLNFVLLIIYNLSTFILIYDSKSKRLCRWNFLESNDSFLMAR